MRKTVIESPRLGEKYLRLEHESGLVILLYPMKGFSTAYALFGTKYGSIDSVFKTPEDPDFIRVPDGIAHYLEHKLFESEEGNVDQLFARTGADSNAFTSFDKTCYLFSCTRQFEESFRYLLRFVQDPYFTPETVAKEQGIIGQEIRMYEDSPDWRVMLNLLEALYAENPVRLDIAGTVESISHITADILYRCYRTFYNLSNMVVTVAGNFDPDAAERILEEELKPGKPVEILRKIPEEPREAAAPEVVQRMDVSEPIFYFGYKIQPETEPHALLRQQVVLDLLLDVLAGPTSRFYEEMNRKGLLNPSFDVEVFGERGSLAAMFGGESRDPREVYRAFCEMVEQRKKEGLSEEEFLCCKNAMYGKSLKGINDVSHTANALISYEMMGVGFFDPIDVIASVELSDLEACLETCFDPACRAISIVLPQEE